MTTNTRNLVMAGFLLGMGFPESAEAMKGRRSMDKGMIKGDQYFSRRLGKTLKRVVLVPSGSFKALGERQKMRKPVYLDWKKLYWGKLSDLVYGLDEDGYASPQPTRVTEPVGDLLDDPQDSQSFVQELRQELKSFAKHYNLKIVWHKKHPELRDATEAFLEYWDQGLSDKEKAKSPKFEELCALASHRLNSWEGYDPDSIKGKGA